MLNSASKKILRYYFIAVVVIFIFYFISADYFYLFSISLINSTILFWGYILIERIFIRKKSVISMGVKARCIILSLALMLMFASIYSLSVIKSFNNSVFFLSISLLILLADSVPENS